MENTQKAELIITALQQRIGEMAATYETQIAALRAELTMMSAQLEKQEATEQYKEELASKLASAN